MSITTKRFLLTLTALAAIAPAWAGFFPGGGLRDHGHTAPADGGVLSNPSITGGSSTFTHVNAGDIRVSGAEGLEVWGAVAMAGSITLGDTSAAESSSGATRTLSHVVAGLNTCLIVTVHDSGAMSSTLPTADGVNMVRLSSATIPIETDTAAIYYLVAPHAGTINVVVTASGSGATLDVQAFTLAGVDQTSPILDSDSRTDAASITSTLTLTGESGGIVIDVIAAWPSLGETVVPTAGQTNISPNTDITGSSSKDGAASVAMTWTTAETMVAHLAVSLKTAAGTTTNRTVILSTSVTTGVLTADTASIQNLSVEGITFSSWTLISVSSYSVPSTGDLNPIPFGAEQYDTLSEFTGNVFTAKHAGYYDINIKGRVNCGNETATLRKALVCEKVNGNVCNDLDTSSVQFTTYDLSTYSHGLSIHNVKYLAVGGTIAGFYETAGGACAASDWNLFIRRVR